MRIAWVVLLATACVLAPGNPATTDRSPVPPAERLNPWSDDVRDLLVPHCGSCHRSTLSTARPGALAVFDLDRPHWYWSMRDEQVADLARRIETMDGIEAADREIVRAFAACELQRDCARE